MRLTALVVLLAGCGTSSDSGGTGKAKPTDEPAVKVAGVWPDKFDCSTVVKVDQVSQLTGGTASFFDNPAAVAPGTPKPCAYEVMFAQPDPLPPDALGRPPESWSFDFDCRANHKQTFEALWVQYTDTNQNRIDAYNETTDAGIAGAKPDANMVLVKPGEAKQVEVGAKALDHNDQSILFLDDDAPCYVRVHGPRAAERLALAQLVAKGLTFMNAPMEPRALP